MLAITTSGGMPNIRIAPSDVEGWRFGKPAEPMCRWPSPSGHEGAVKTEELKMPPVMYNMINVTGWAAVLHAG